MKERVMSLPDQLTLQTGVERRRGERTHVTRELRARIGRHDALVLDLSMRGARVNHEALLQRGSTIRLSFRWYGVQFDAAAEILASRIVTLGAGLDQRPLYESRVRFASMTLDAMDVLSRAIAGIATEQLRTWVGNLQGESAPTSTAGVQPLGFIRCRAIYRRWEKKWTRDASHPDDGFTVPAGTPVAEVEALCRAWESMDDDSRELLRLTANVVAEHQSHPCPPL